MLALVRKLAVTVYNDLNNPVLIFMFSYSHELIHCSYFRVFKKSQFTLNKTLEDDIKDKCLPKHRIDGIMDNTANPNDKNTRDTTNNSSLEGFLKFFSMLLIIITFPISFFFCLKIVKEYERAVIFRLGRLKDGHGVVGPGLFFIIPCMDEIRVVDLRTISFDVPAQEVLTKDHVTVLVDAVVYYSVFDAMLAVCEVEMAGVSTRLLAATTLRNMMGTKTLEEILSQKEETAKVMKETMDGATDP